MLPFYFLGGGLFPLPGPDGLPVLLGKLGLGRLPPPFAPPFPPPPLAIEIIVLMDVSFVLAAHADENIELQYCLSEGLVALARDRVGSNI